jgi:hypothetical protein
VYIEDEKCSVDEISLTKNHDFFLNKSSLRVEKKKIKLENFFFYFKKNLFGEYLS